MIFPDIYGLRKKLLRADRVIYLFALLLLICAFILEAHSFSAVAIAHSPQGEKEYFYASYFSLSLIQYGNSYPFACGVMSVLIIISSAICLSDHLRSMKIMYATLASNILTLLFALLPLFVFGRDCITSFGAGILSCLLASVILQTSVLIYESYARRKNYE